MSDDPICTLCKHPRSEHEIEPPYTCLHSGDADNDPYYCGCEGFNYAVTTAPSIVLRANAYFGRFGVSFNCVRCGVELKVMPSGTLAHPSRKSLFRKREIDCQFRGKFFENPFMNMSLEPSK